MNISPVSNTSFNGAIRLYGKKVMFTDENEERELRADNGKKALSVDTSNPEIPIIVDTDYITKITPHLLFVKADPKNPYSDEKNEAIVWMNMNNEEYYKFLEVYNAASKNEYVSVNYIG